VVLIAATPRAPFNISRRLNRRRYEAEAISRFSETSAFMIEPRKVEISTSRLKINLPKSSSDGREFARSACLH